MSIRRRLSVLFAAIWAGLYLVFTMSVYVSFRSHLEMEVDASLSGWSGYIIESETGNRRDDGAFRNLPSDQAGRGIEMPDTFVLLFSPSGDILVNRSTFSENELSSVRMIAFETGSTAEGRIDNHRIDGQDYRTLTVRSSDTRGNLYILGRSLVHVNSTLESLFIFLAIAWIFAVVIGSTVMWILVGYTLLPIHRMTRRSLEISGSGRLGERIEEVSGKDEFGELSRALNRMLSSMQNTFESQKRFLADVSHELRTPLTSIRANLEYLRRARNTSEEDRAAALTDCSIEVERMAGLVNDLLLLARSDSAPSHVRERIDIGTLSEEVFSEFKRQKTATERNFRLCLPGERLLTLGDGRELRQALVMLLDNALKYSGNGGTISLSVERERDAVRILLEDDGPGIPPGEIDSVWERFFRASNIRDKVPGSGLGLPIVRSIIDRHSGRIMIENRIPHGLLVTISLPSAQ